MPAQRPATIAEYLQAAPPASHPHLRRLYAILKKAAPHAEEAIKWNTPFFVEPRFVFAFAGHKAHASFVPPAPVLVRFRQELKKQKTTKNMLQLPYADPLPEDLIRRMAEYSVQVVRERTDDGFW